MKNKDNKSKIDKNIYRKLQNISEEMKESMLKDYYLY